ncbi:MAG: DEAD/DEAH box helicase [Armatimonadota bacterium]|nr:DEAD/DEAH box helicase [Armatimonadota bacterium]MDR7543048.1 DEAD/DEAH box helicase [Armatimonadota bacterium]
MLKFPLLDKVTQAGAFAGKSLLIAAPTATGKSKIGIDLLFYYLASKPTGAANVYLVPYRALAREVFAAVLERGRSEAPRATIKVATGDYADPELDLGHTDILVATYEKCDSLLREEPDFQPNVIVADEIHHLGDAARGARIEGLLTRLTTGGRTPLLFLLSATVGNAEELARWLGIKPVIGDETDRVVALLFKPRFTDDKASVVEREVIRTLRAGGQVLVFCGTRKRAEHQATELAGAVGKTLSAVEHQRLSTLAGRVRESPGATEQMVRLTAQGVAYHHAGLDSDLRALIEQSFRERDLRVIACTPTLAGGVNLPARLVIVRDAYRMTFFRGRVKKSFLKAGEVLQMLGRAGRPGLDTEGRGLVLFDVQDESRPEVQALWQAIEAKQAEHVESQIEKRFNYLMEFLLGGVNLHGPCEIEVLASLVKRTFWYFQKRPRMGDEDAQAIQAIIDGWEATDRITGAFRLEELVATASGISAKVQNVNSTYAVKVSLAHFSCECPAFRFTPGRLEPCKHIAYLFHELLLGRRSDDPELRNVAVQLFLDLFGEKVGVLAKLREALRILKRWQFISERQERFSITKPGRVALASYLDLSLTHEISLRVLHDRGHAAESRLLKWATQDALGPEETSEDWIEILDRWMSEVPREEIEREVGYFPDFLAMRDQVTWVLLTYYRFAGLYEKAGMLNRVKTLMRRLQYGVKEDLLPLAVLDLPDIGRGRLRHLARKGIGSLWDLAQAVPERITARSILPRAIAERSVGLARERAGAVEALVRGFPTRELRDREREVAREIGRVIFVSAENVRDLLYPEIVRRYGRG